MAKILKLFLLTLSLIGILQSNVSAGEVEQRAFIERFYQNIMNRTADSGGMSTWLNVIQTESATKVALGFFKSQEFINKNLSNEQFVDILYSTLFDRQADTDGRTGWINQLNSGTSQDEVMYGFFNAQEFANLANRFGVTQIRPEDQLNAGTTGVDGYVNRFYTLVLNRNADSSGFNDWKNQLNSGTKAGGDIAKGFFNSQEYLNRGLDNSTFLDICYRAFFNREADAGGKSNWITQLSQGKTKDQVLDGFIDSQEFINLANGFGIKNRFVASPIASVITDKKVSLYDNAGSAVASFNTNGVYSETWSDTVEGPGSCSGKWKDLGSNKIAVTCADAGTTVDPDGTLVNGDDESHFQFKANTLNIGDTVTLSEAQGTTIDSFDVKVSSIDAISSTPTTSFVSGKKYVVYDNEGDVSASFNSDGTYSESGIDGDGPYTCIGRWKDFGNNKIASTCDTNAMPDGNIDNNEIGILFNSNSPKVGDELTINASDGIFIMKIKSISNL